MPDVQKTLLASELIAALQAGIAKRGDLPVWLDDPDTGWPLGIALDPEAANLTQSEMTTGPCMSIVAGYFPW